MYAIIGLTSLVDRNILTWLLRANWFCHGSISIWLWSVASYIPSAINRNHGFCYGLVVKYSIFIQQIYGALGIIINSCRTGSKAP
ncbi:hypothetical protein ACN38_g8152 [Penicillium nordicum]|uniref:Uncharacterized protein n=1 Tax=Penicillium nordicum TaxID=229535 RepID=A0A0N0RYC5_9EURO|nr:hypothetical protein ACN38_g8152 [Penicillium nordicum]